jgi:hypothetical protein
LIHRYGNPASFDAKTVLDVAGRERDRLAEDRQRHHGHERAEQTEPRHRSAEHREQREDDRAEQRTPEQRKQAVAHELRTRHGRREQQLDLARGDEQSAVAERVGNRQHREHEDARAERQPHSLGDVESRPAREQRRHQNRREPTEDRAQSDQREQHSRERLQTPPLLAEHAAQLEPREQAQRGMAADHGGASWPPVVGAGRRAVAGRALERDIELGRGEEDLLQRSARVRREHRARFDERPDEHAAARAQDQDARGELLDQLELVRRQDHRRALARELADRELGRADTARVEARQRLVEQHELGPRQPRAAEAQLLPHAARQLAAERVTFLLELEPPQQLVRARAPLAHAVQRRRELEVLEHGQRVERLRVVGHPAQATLRARLFARHVEAPRSTRDPP